MKKQLKKIIVAIVICMFMLPVFVNASQNEAKTLDVMFLHDTHSHLNPFTTVENGKSQTMGGFA